MDNINELPDELMVKILTFVPTKVAVSTSILSKRWESIWKSVPKLECHCDVFKPEILDVLNKNLPLRARFIESLCLKFCEKSRQEKIEMWVGVGDSRCLREVRVNHISFYGKPYVFFPSSLYTCKTLVTMKLEDSSILVDAPQDVCLPCLKILHLQCVTYSNQDSLPLLLSYCPVLEDLLIARGFKMDNVKAVVVTVPTLLRLSLKSTSALTHDKYVIVTPSLKYFKFKDNETDNLSELVETMSELVEADISVCKNIEMFLKSVTSVKRLTLRQLYNSIDKYPFGIEFNQLLVVLLLFASPNLRVLNLYVDSDAFFIDYEPDYWKSTEGCVPKCLKSSLETLEFTGYCGGEPEERDFLSFIFKNACCLKTSSISQ